MRALRDKRQEFIDECIAEEKRLHEEARYQEKLHKAATIIQSIWRGHMVRHKLGGFKDSGKRTKSHKQSRKAEKKTR